MKWIGICFVGLIVLGIILEATKSPEKKTAEVLQRKKQAAAIRIAKPSAAAIDSLNVDWNEQATRSAKQYLSMQGFSCKGLVSQLSSRAGEKFTVNQATYGAQQAGACN